MLKLQNLNLGKGGWRQSQTTSMMRRRMKTKTETPPFLKRSGEQEAVVAGALESRRRYHHLPRPLLRGFWARWRPAKEATLSNLKGWKIILVKTTRTWNIHAVTLESEILLGGNKGETRSAYLVWWFEEDTWISGMLWPRLDTVDGFMQWRSILRT